MNKNRINLVPGPTNVPETVLQAMSNNFASGDLDRSFLTLYNETEEKLQQILGTKNQIIMQTGEGMWGLWGALKSTIKPGDRVVSLCTGVFGHGIAEMASKIGAEVLKVELGFDQTIIQADALREAVEKHDPVLITAVHCETPSGTVNPLSILADVKREFPRALLCVDTVASAGAMPIEIDQHLVDLSLNGSQKALSAPPSMSFVSVSPAAWERIEAVAYAGYDAFLPFKNAARDFFFPNTPYWHGMAALNEAANLILQEGLENVFKRHLDCMTYCHQRIEQMGLKLFPKPEANPASTVTAVYLPKGYKWNEFFKLCLDKDLVVAGSYGELSGKVFRIGHMGSQAQMELLEAGLDLLQTLV